jgi:hypothetical protein
MALAISSRSAAERSDSVAMSIPNKAGDSAGGGIDPPGACPRRVALSPLGDVAER